MKRTVVIGMALAVFFGTILAPAQQRPGLGAAPPGAVLWTRQFGSSKRDEAHGVAADAWGNVLVMGWTEGVLPGQKSAGNLDAFVRKYDPGGRKLWTRQFGSTDDDVAFGVAADAWGNVLVVGWTAGTLPGQKSAGNLDAFVRKYDPGGRKLWTRQFGNTDDDMAHGVAADAWGNVLVVGWTAGTLPGQKSAGWADAFVRKYDSTGKHLWTRQFGSMYDDEAFGVAADAWGNVLVVGVTYDVLPGQKSAGASDAFVRKYDSTGKHLWTRQFGSTAGDEAFGVAADARGNVLVVGVTWDALPGQKSAGKKDAFVRKYDPGGRELWTRQFGSTDYDVAFGVAADAWGNVLVVGWTEGVLPGQKRAGNLDAFVRKYDPGGRKLWTRQFGSEDMDEARGVAADAWGNVLVVGWTAGTLPGQKSAGGWDAFVRKYSP